MNTRLPLAALVAEVRALRQELAALAEELRHCREEQSLLRQALSAPSSDPTARLPDSPLTTALARSAPRLHQEVWRRLEAGSSSDDDTGLDLLIDRLHDLALEQGG